MRVSGKGLQLPHCPSGHLEKPVRAPNRCPKKRLSRRQPNFFSMFFELELNFFRKKFGISFDFSNCSEYSIIRKLKTIRSRTENHQPLFHKETQLRRPSTRQSLSALLSLQRSSSPRQLSPATITNRLVRATASSLRRTS